VPELVDLPAGCPFAGRCAWTVPECLAAPIAPHDFGNGHEARCIRLEDVARDIAKQAAAPRKAPA